MTKPMFSSFLTPQDVKEVELKLHNFQSQVNKVSVVACQSLEVRPPYNH